MRALAIGIFALGIVGCQSPADGEWTYSPLPEREYEPAFGSDTPTVADLKSKGFVQTGSDNQLFGCGTSCTGIYVYAVFYGDGENAAATQDHGYTCPNPKTEAPEAEWLCKPFTEFRGAK